MDRRQAFILLGATALGTLSPYSRSLAIEDAAGKPKSIVVVITWYTENSHADVIFGKILAGWKQDGGPCPRLKLASIYVDQFPDNGLSLRRW